MRFTQSTLLVSALAVAANAHIRMRNPVPFGLDDGTLTQDPLLEDGSNFPCKVVGGNYPKGTVNNWKAGETIEVDFLGTAVHGGGSCQFAITTDERPTKQSDWRVIHSVIGGCPKNTPGNVLPEDRNGKVSDKFPVTMPQGIPDGMYTFAWIWFNKVGNREMYMNCAAVSVTGGGGDRNSLKSLPTMQVANAPKSQCTTTENFDMVFDNPGTSVVTSPNAVPGNFTGPGCKSSPGTGGGSGGGGQASQKPSSAPASSAAASKPLGTPATSAAAAPSKTGGVFAPGAGQGSASAAVPTTFATAPAATSAAAQSPAAAAPSTGNGSTSSSTVPCTNEGAVVCIGSDKFGLCDHGAAFPMALAAGMSCSNGQLQKRAVHPHMHRRHGSHVLV